jgi:hypothetical protein
MRRFMQSPNYIRVRAALGILYVLLGTVVLIRTCIPLSQLNFAKIPALALGIALVGLGILRVREFLLQRNSSST